MSGDIFHWVRKGDGLVLVPYESANDEELWIADTRTLTWDEWRQERYAGTKPEPRPEYGPRYYEPLTA